MVLNRDFLDELVVVTTFFFVSVFYFLEGTNALVAILAYFVYLLLPSNVQLWPPKFVSKSQFMQAALALPVQARPWKDAVARCGPATNEQYVVVGGAGFVGARIVHALVLRGETKVRVVDMDEKGLEELKARYPSGVVECVKADVRKDFTDVVKGADCVYAPFAVIRYWETLPRDWHKSLDINVNGTRNVIDACVKAGVKRLVVTSSSAAVEVFPSWFPEGINENSPYCTKENYSNNYCLSKSLQEQEALRRNGEGGLAIGAIRPCSDVFGYGDKLVLKMAFDAKSYPVIDGFKPHDYVHVDNVVYGHLLLESRLRNGPSDAAAGKAFCISGGTPVRGGEVAALCSHYAQKHGFQMGFGFLPLRIVAIFGLIMSIIERIFPGDMVRTFGQTIGKVSFAVVLQSTNNIVVKNSTMPKEILGYEPVLSVHAAIEKTMREYKEDKIIFD